ncbi:hypothetical protein [Stackebrandtia soli]|uniref:hypothetical protein n=1 Tax=Stackebrandtia soli TaxID=1892856 RepID=UPI0039EA1D50
MTRRASWRRAIGVGSVAGLLLTGCGGFSPPGSNGPGDEKKAPASHIVFMAMDGCFTLKDLQPVQDYLGVEAIRGDGLMSSDSTMQERPSCQGMFTVATFTPEFSDRGMPGDGDVSVAIDTEYTADEAATDYQDMIDQLHEANAATSFENVQEGEISGTWDESYYFTGDSSGEQFFYGYARHDTWVLRVSLSIHHDPGIVEYERAPDRYPDSSAAEMAAYPFTKEELVSWLTTEYYPQTQSEFLAAIAEHEKANAPE